MHLLVRAARGLAWARLRARTSLERAVRIGGPRLALWSTRMGIWARRGAARGGRAVRGHRHALVALGFRLLWWGCLGTLAVTGETVVRGSREAPSAVDATTPLGFAFAAAILVFALAPRRHLRVAGGATAVLAGAGLLLGWAAQS